MHNGVIRIEQVVTELGNRDVPNLICRVVCRRKKIPILRMVTEDGGYGKCDVSDAFDRFIERVRVHRGEGVDEKMDVYFERNGTHYRLYLPSTASPRRRRSGWPRQSVGPAR